MTWILSRRFVVALGVTLLALWLFKASYFQENSEAYLFPTIITGVVLLFSLISFFREVFGLCVDDFVSVDILRLVPALIIMIAAVFVAEPLGMYFTALLTLFGLSFWYSPESNLFKRLRDSSLLSFGFIAFIYLLFSIMLGVQFPRGVLI